MTAHLALQPLPELLLAEAGAELQELAPVGDLVLHNLVLAVQDDVPATGRFCSDTKCLMLTRWECRLNVGYILIVLIQPNQ